MGEQTTSKEPATSIEQALRESEERFSTAFHYNAAGCSISRVSDGHFIDVNAAFLSAFGYERSEVIGRSAQELGLYDDPTERARIVGALEAGSAVSEYEMSGRTKAGNAIDLLVSMRVIDIAGERCILATGYDITRRKRAEAEIKTQSEILRTIFDHSPIMFCLFDEHARKKFVNRSWEEAFGWSNEEIQQRKHDILAEVLTEPEEYQRALRLIKSGNGEWGDFKARTKDGRIVYVAATAIRLSDGTTIGIAQDITARKEAEERLLQAGEQLRALFARLSSVREQEARLIAAEVHDELGSVLTGMRWELESIHNAASRIEVRNIDAILKRLLSVMEMTENAVKTVRRISSELRPPLLDGVGIAEAIEEYAREFAGRTGIVCGCDCDLEDVSVNEDLSTILFRIVQEALTNVARHSGATAVSLKLTVEGEDVVLSIHDNGRGITAEEQTRKGSLGLLGMRERAQSVGGQLTVTGAAGQGTTVAVRVPLVPPDR